MQFYSAVKKDEGVQFTAMWMALESFLLNEISRKEDRYRIRSLVWGAYGSIVRK